MKTRTRITAAVAGLFAGLAACFGYAAEVSRDDALCAVKGWVSLKESLDESVAGNPASVETFTGRSGKGKFYVVTLEGGGYVVASGDDGATPILAYSKSGTFEADEKNPLWSLLAGRAAIEAERLAAGGRRALAAGAGPGVNAAKWNRLRAAGAGKALQASSQAAPTDLRVPSLIQSDWSQGRIGNYGGTDYPYCFNMYTPEIDGERAVCGCVATSGAQIMRYFQWPQAAVTALTKSCTVNDTATDLTMMGGTYDWANMPTNINSMYRQPESATLAYRQAIGKLTYDIGVSVEMDYGAGGSGAAIAFLAQSFKNVFGYKNAAYFYASSGFSADKIKQAILPNLDAKRPCSVGIANSGDNSGHAIVADGYGYSDGTLYIHFNMGWANAFKSNAWYAPPEFDVDGTVEYDTLDEVVCNIFTDDGAEYGSIASGRVLDNEGNPVAGATVTARTTLQDNTSTNIVVTSDERGIYAFLLPAVQKPCTVTAAYGGSVSAEASFTIAQTRTSVGNLYGLDLTVNQAPAPRFSPDGGRFYVSPLAVTVTCPLEDATIRYTLDGTEPTASSPSVANGGTVSVERSLTLRAKAFADGCAASSTASAAFTYITDLETPDAFVEYVESTGTQFVDTGICPRPGTKAEVKFSRTAEVQTFDVIMGSSGAGGYYYFGCIRKPSYIGVGCGGRRHYVDTDNQYGFADSCSILESKTISNGTQYTITTELSTEGEYNIDTLGGSIDGGYGYHKTRITVPGDSLSSENPLWIFASDNNGELADPSKVRVYGVKIWQTDSNGDYQLVRDFRPCRRYDRGALWDAVSRKIFYSGSGTDLTAGPAVTPEFERRAVDYVESTGSQYINTGVCPKYGTKTETVFAPMEQVGTFDVFLGSGPTGGYYYFGCLRSPWYIGAGCGTQRAYADVPGWGFADSCGILSNANTSKGVKYTITTELSPEGDYNIDTLGGSINGGYAYHKTKIVEQGDFLSSDKPLWVFGSNNNGSLADPSKIRCYGVKIWQTNGVDGTYVLVRDLSPCQKDGKGALYDSVNDEVLFPGAGVLLTSSSAVWNNTAGDNSFENPANWSTGAVPSDGDSVTVNVSGETTLIVTEVHALGVMSVAGSGTLRFVGDGSLSYMRLNIASGTTVVRTGTAGLVDGGLSGTGSFVLDPGAGNTVTMTKNNLDFLGEAVVKSGIVKFGDYQSFGKIGRNVFIRVCTGAVLDENGQTYYPEGVGEPLSKAILEEGAELRSNPGYGQVQYSALTTLNLEGNATIDTSYGNVTISERWNDHAVSLGLGEYTLTVKGDKTFSISYCTISGTGTLDILSGATVESTHDFDNVDVSTTCADGTIRIREGGKWSLANYQNRVSKLSVKNLILDGAMTRAVNTYTLTVTGSITGKGTTPTLTMAEGAVFKPTGTGYLTITESLSGTMTIDASGLGLETAGSRIPLFKAGSAEVLSGVPVDFAAGTKPRNWSLVKTTDGLGYDLRRSGFSVILR